jgi:hypothetical protein
MTALYHPGVVTIVPYYDLGHTNPAANVTHWQTAVTGLTGAMLSAIRTAFDTSWFATWKGVGSSTNNYLGCWVIDNSSSTGLQVTNAGYTPQAGLSPATSWPDSTAALLSLRTVMRYRGGHGRVYIPGLSSVSVQNDGMQLTTATQSTLTTLWTSTVTAMAALSSTSGGPLTPIVWNKKLSSNPNSVQPVVTQLVQPILATQRRRLRKVSRHRRRVP